MAQQTKERSIITDKLVLPKTGKRMEEWFMILDKKGAKKMNHPEIFYLVSSIDELKALGEWNQNLLATSYEWNRGLKGRGEKENGYEVGVSKTIAVNVSVLYQSFVDAKIRKKWLTESIEIRKATENKSARITWSDQVTSLSVDFYPKGDDKAMVVVQHLKIPDSTKAAELKTFWIETLGKLKVMLEA